MYEIFCNLTKKDEKYFLVNSLEVGSLPDTYHFHILKQKEINNISNLKTFSDEEYIINNIKIYIINDKYIYKSLYIIYDINIGIINKIPLLLEKLRSYDNKHYMAQIFFIKIEDNKKYIDCLVITFKRVIITKKILNESNKFNQDYYDELFGNKNDKYEKLIYYPIGIIFYKNKDNIFKQRSNFRK